MRKSVFLMLVCLLSYIDVTARHRDISLTAGTCVPMYKGIENDVVIDVNYGVFQNSGLGFRAGLQWAPSVANVDNAFGVPLAIAWRTSSRSSTERLQSGMAGAAGTILYSPGYGQHSAGSVLGGFLMNLFSDLELFTGITPGYIAGTSSSVHQSAWGNNLQYREVHWTEKTQAFSVTLDAGFSVNYRIWRIDLKLIPIFHYSLSRNYRYHQNDASTPLRWFFSMSGGLAFHF